MSKILDKLPEDTSLWTKADIIFLLNARGDAQEQLFSRARTVRNLCGLENIVIRGVIEISNYCQKKCTFCAMRCHNKSVNRYRLSAEEILATAEQIHDIPEINVCFLQSGQDPHIDKILGEAIIKLRERFGMEVLLNLGEKDAATYHHYAQLGAESYILKFETSDATLYRDIAHSSLDDRLQCIKWVTDSGMRLGTGNIVGIPGQNISSMADDILLATRLRPAFASTAPFIPNVGTPLQDNPYGDFDVALNTIAILRIMLGNVRIPAVSALEKLRPGGQLMGINAGANVLTVNFTPEYHQTDYRIYSDKRFVVKLDHAFSVAEHSGLPIWEKEYV
ncbi:MAG: radical SAM protein [Candidatus Thiosymbion ectosymbiont of Robbea hypermnestra]|nr:radical SAM protein [Candidatus Thiosymbion ectosymbiont of Robbea hypermnestra]